MKPRVIMLSGRPASGKSALAMLLSEKLSAEVLDAYAVLHAQAPSTEQSSEQMRRLLARTERATGGRWLANAFAESRQRETPPLWVIDSVQTVEQIHFLRLSGWVVTHVHLNASDSASAARTAAPGSVTNVSQSSVSLSAGLSAKHIRALEAIADVVIDTDRCNANDVYARVAARLEVRPVIAQPLVDVLVGGQYGSEGKGNIANYLAPEYDVLVRVGGPNAGHKVFRRDDSPYTFHQLPSGALANSDAILVIGAGAVISLDRLRLEIGQLYVEYRKLIIDPQAMIIDKALDIEWEERNLKQAIGSTAQGVGMATARKILNRRPDTDVRLAKDVPELKHYIRDSVEFFASCLSSGKKVMLEGTQGTSLSLHHGHYPHVTSRVTTATGCLAEAGLSSRHVRRIIMVCRTYPIRVGDTDTGNTSGYMSQEITVEEIAQRSGILLEELKRTETTSTTHRPRRIAEFDWAQLRRSLVLNGPTDIALTFADYFGVDNRKAYRYEQLNAETLRFIEEAEKVSGVPVSMISTAFNERNIIDRRMW
ncbi:adenylosuccinate synthetase [Paraburkholderia aspalathi]|uniref:Adenylosuccinate synthetase n=1 Tax=Paraburkholderia aspalathi TaxID=1324617 RepID=A0A1I7CDU3_9BURK|nr:adenylosuccinate synthetase [Paraburkholderia aspalathi]SFT97582.1 adenylosuccinate synthase [Paraburkholderia aspalathi]